MEHHYVAPRAAHAGRRLARPGQPGLRPHQPGDLRARCRARASSAMSGKLCDWDRTADLGRDHGADARHRRAPRHDGPGLHGDDGGPPPDGAATCTARTAATWRCTTTRRPTSPAWSTSCATPAPSRNPGRAGCASSLADQEPSGQPGSGPRRARHRVRRQGLQERCRQRPGTRARGRPVAGPVDHGQNGAGNVLREPLALDR